jgi:hypothetical protein
MTFPENGYAEHLGRSALLGMGVEMWGAIFVRPTWVTCKPRDKYTENKVLQMYGSEGCQA